MGLAKCAAVASVRVKLHPALAVAPEYVLSMRLATRRGLKAPECRC